MHFPILETNRLSLIELTSQHAESMFAILSLEEVMRYYGSDPFSSQSESLKLIEMFQKNYREKRGIRWGIILKENQRLIGSLGLNAWQPKNKRAEIGYEIHPDYWSNGYTTEAIHEVLRYSYQELELHRIGAVVYPENRASLHLLKKIGFLEEGLLRGYMHQNNQSQDTVVLSLLKPEWEKSQE